MGKFSFSIKTETQKENTSTAYKSEIPILKMAKTAKTVDPNTPFLRGWTDREMFSRRSVRFSLASQRVISLREEYRRLPRLLLLFFEHCSNSNS